jgi:hypothetical protein
MSVKSAVIINAQKDAPEPGQVTADVIIDGENARCVVEYDGDRALLIQRDSPLERRPNAWRAVSFVLYQLHLGEKLTFPLDVTNDVNQGPWPH